MCIHSFIRIDFNKYTPITLFQQPSDSYDSTITLFNSHLLNYQSISLLGKIHHCTLFSISYQRPLFNKYLLKYTSLYLISFDCSFFLLIRFLFSSYFTTTNCQVNLAHEGLNPPSLFFFLFISTQDHSNTHTHFAEIDALGDLSGRQ